jgi:hypothetical protein
VITPACGGGGALVKMLFKVETTSSGGESDTCIIETAAYVRTKHR